jgi:MinD superfamily P-loop ATPase
MSKRNCETCEACHKICHPTFRAAQKVARQTGHRHENDHRHFRPYRCRCNRYVVGTADIFYVRSDVKLRNQRREEHDADY